MPAAALAAGAVVGGLIQADAADSAARTQANAAGRGIDEQRRQFDITQANQQPWLTQGRGALYKLSDLLGVSSPVGPAPTREQFMIPATRGESYQPAAGLSFQYRGGTPASFDQDGYDRAMAAWQSSQMPRSADFGSLLTPFTGADLVNEPGYQFGLNQGQQAIDQSAAARGSLLSGKTLKDLMTFGQDYAGTKYGEAFNRDAANKSRKFSMLGSLSGIGQNTATNLGQLGQANATSLSDLIGSQGAARAAGQIGSANALTGTLGSLGNIYMQDQWLDAYKKAHPAQPQKPQSGNVWSNVGDML